jgi:very-short-patch-repair endonuclease
MVLVMAGLPRPEVQVPLRAATGFLGRADLYYPEPRLVIEYDGATHRDSVTADNRRQNRLVEAGYRVLRFSAADVFGQAAAVAATVRQGLRA